jgi:hypothetical protein
VCGLLLLKERIDVVRWVPRYGKKSHGHVLMLAAPS